MKISMALFETGNKNKNVSGLITCWITGDGNYNHVIEGIIDKDGNYSYRDYAGSIVSTTYFTTTYTGTGYNFYAKVKLLHNGQVYNAGNLVAFQLVKGKDTAMQYANSFIVL